MTTSKAKLQLNELEDKVLAEIRTGTNISKACNKFGIKWFEFYNALSLTKRINLLKTNLDRPTRSCRTKIKYMGEHMHLED